MGKGKIGVLELRWGLKRCCGKGDQNVPSQDHSVFRSKFSPKNWR
jgi:hypothetical protein